MFVFFENGNPMRPIYFASIPSGNGDWYNGTAGTYPHNIAFKSHGGHIIEVDSTPDAKRYKIHHPSGTVIDVDNEGNVHSAIYVVWDKNSAYYLMSGCSYYSYIQSICIHS